MPIVVYWIGAFLDFATTRKGLRAGFREGNPLVRYVLDKLPYDSEVELAGLKVVIFSALFLLQAPAWVFYALGALQFAAALHNFRLLKKAHVV